ncbi:MAG: hypothetical protein IJO33_04065 [Bacilli bacterium]|nr:hypothetical protein [Bacilli bacterium]
MAKLKLSLPSGSEVEKTVISYFKSNETNYLILDAESVGSMGLPIILVCKVMGDKVIKIVDQNEWQQVKTYLKSIISGEKMDYIAAPISLPADEVYYTQLTLPVASFDILKRSYMVENLTSEVAAPIADNVVAEVAPVIPAVEEPVVGEQPINMATDITNDAPMMAEITMPVSSPDEPLANDMIAPVESAAVVDTPLETAPISENNIDMTSPLMNEGLNSSETPDVAPIMAEPIVSETVIAPAQVIETPEPVVEPIVNNTPVIEETPFAAVEPVQEAAKSKMDFSDCKTMFMQACENMFDALAAKIEAELKNK